MEKKTEDKKNNLKIIYIALSIMFITPSLTYIFAGKSIFKLISSFNFFLLENTKEMTTEKMLGTISFIGLFIGIAIVYFMILKHYKTIFKTDKQMTKFILIISFIFSIMLPLTSTDVFYYMATGWSEAKYGVNPYYTSVEDLTKENSEASEDIMLQKMPNVWRETTIVYGPIWPFICKILSGLSMGSIELGLFIYKLFNLCIHLLNSYLIYKITNKKKVFTLMYALNPLILFSGLSNVHNDLLVVFFILAALYFFVKKKKMLPTVIFLALATALKYYAILFIPFLVIYHYKKEKPFKKFFYSCGWAILFLVIIFICYLLYMRNFEVLKGIMVQQNKFANSIFLVIALEKSVKFASIVSKGAMLAFIVLYLYTIIRLLFTKKEINFKYLMREYNVFLLFFIFGTITNFHDWYILWIFPTLMWQKGKTIKNILSISIISEIANVVFFAQYESSKYGKYYYIIMIILFIISTKIDVNKIFKVGDLISEKSTK